MRKQRTLSLTIAALTLSACALPGTHLPTRLETNPLGFHASPLQSDGLTEQAHALNANAKAIVRASTVKGAVIGAAVGCGLTVLTNSASGNCVKAAAIGAAGGAIAGHVAGQKDVKRRVELASPNALVRNLRKANTNLETITTSLPTLLAAQDAELNRLSLAFAANQITPETHAKAVQTIRSDRADLASALMMSAREARQASKNLREAAAKGHSGLDWHISATDQLARDTHSARSSISLL